MEEKTNEALRFKTSLIDIAREKERLTKAIAAISDTDDYL